MSDSVEKSGYRITGKVVQTIEPSGFIVENSSGKSQALSNEEVIKLARAGKLENAEALMSIASSGFLLHTSEPLVKIPTVRNVKNTKLKIINRIVSKGDNPKCLGYTVVADNGKQYKMTVGKTWVLAVNNSITNIEAFIYKGKKVLRSTEGRNLYDLPIIHE